ncbi:MAG: MgtC/SapB family protein [Aliifodinibius sp.]|nr:MgtC/SapB family protein [Fodinibius sp.]NIV14742.1 MgtC/SapB family protein [Fodinibius sp.]NIY28637.1 MgtC/SapB family protein [Fodinibius sp.]
MDVWTSLQLSIFGEILLAILLGGMVGIEREYANKSAGLRTHILVAISASLITALGNFIVNESNFPRAVSTDPVRIIQAIVVGISSFLGAGTILQREYKGSVEGLTTSASILATAAIGIAVSLDLVLLASLTTVTILIVNRLLNPLERWIVNRITDINSDLVKPIDNE